MLQHARPGNRALLRHVSHEEHGAVVHLRETHDVRRAFPHLRHATRRGGNIRSVHRLNRVDHHGARLNGQHALLNDGHVVFRQHIKAAAVRAQPRSAQLDLPHRFLAGHIQHLVAPGGKIRRELRKQRALADAGVAAHQHHAALHHAAAQHAIQFADAAGHACGRLVGNLADRKRHAAASRRALQLFLLYLRLLNLLGKGVPFSAVRAFAQPFGRRVAAFTAYVHRFALRHFAYRLTFAM